MTIRNTFLLLAAALGCVLSAEADATIVTQSFAISASGFEARAPFEPVTGTFTFTYDKDAFLTPPSPAGLTISGFNVPYAGPALFSFIKGSDIIVVGNNIGLGTYTVSPSTPGFGFVISHPGGTPTISSFTYSAGGHLWHAGSIDVAAVPEPATWAMMIGGFALAGSALRASRRERRPAQLAV